MNYSLLTKLNVLLVVLSLSVLGQAQAKDINQEQLQQLMKSNQQLVILDVRTADEFAKGHIPNAINISHDELKSRLLELNTAKDKQIVIYCRSGRRAEVARELLNEQGFTHLDHLSGDFNGWTSNKLPVATK